VPLGYRTRFRVPLLPLPRVVSRSGWWPLQPRSRPSDYHCQRLSIKYTLNYRTKVSYSLSSLTLDSHGLAVANMVPICNVTGFSLVFTSGMPQHALCCLRGVSESLVLRARTLFSEPSSGSFSHSCARYCVATRHSTAHRWCCVLRLLHRATNIVESRLRTSLGVAQLPIVLHIW
jgi:hypothetical protein